MKINEDLLIGDEGISLKELNEKIDTDISNLSALKKKLPANCEWGTITGDKMAIDTTLNQAYITVTFKNCYTKTPTIICSDGARSGRGY